MRRNCLFLFPIVVASKHNVSDFQKCLIDERSSLVEKSKARKAELSRDRFFIHNRQKVQITNIPAR